MKLWQYVIGLLAVNCNMLTYKMNTYERACFYEQTSVENQQVMFYFTVIHGNDIDVKITDLKQNKIIHSSDRKPEGDFVLTIPEPAEIMICFSNGKSSFEPKIVEFDVTLSHVPETSSNMGQVEEALDRLQQELSNIKQNLSRLRGRVLRNMETVQSAESRIFYFSILEAVMIVFMAILQVYVLKNYFAPKGNIRI